MNCVTDQEKKQKYERYAEIKSKLDELFYPVLDSMITCPPKQNTFLPEEVTAQYYNLCLDEQFDGQINPADWETKLAWGPDVIINNEEQIYIDTQDPNFDPTYAGIDPFSYSADGNLIITAAPLPQSIQDSTGRHFSSGVIKSTKCYKYGYVEYDVKLPCNADGAWIALWLLNCEYYDFAGQNPAPSFNDKFNPEIDFEFVYGPGQGGSMCAKSAYHYETGDRTSTTNYKRWSIDSAGFREFNVNTGMIDSSGNQYPSYSGQLRSELNETCSVDYCLDFHKFGILWTPEKIEWFIDGQRINCIKNNLAPNSPDLIADQAMYPIINYAVGGDFPFGGNVGIPPTQFADQSTYPSQLEIRSVKIYELL